MPKSKTVKVTYLGDSAAVVVDQVRIEHGETVEVSAAIAAGLNGPAWKRGKPAATSTAQKGQTS